MLLIAFIIQTLNAFKYNYYANKPYLLIEIFSEEFVQLKITIYEDAVKQSEISSLYDQYLSTYYKVRVGEEYNLEISLTPESNYTITETEEKTCPNNCSSQGICQSGSCSCYDMMIGSRCQYEVIQQHEQTFNMNFKSHETQAIGIYYTMEELVDDQGQIKKLHLISSNAIQSTIYLLMPFEYPAKKAIDSRIIYNSMLTDATIDYGSVFQSYHIKQVSYTFIIVLENLFTSKQITLSSSLISQDQGFQDFILVAILSVVAFVIFLIIIYVVRKRCQYMSGGKKDEQVVQKNIILNMPIVVAVKDQECIICLDQLDSQQCRQTPCKHLMHEECLLQWCQKQQTCPICRESLNEDDSQPRFKLRNPPTTFLNGQSGLLVQSDRNSVRSMILYRSRQSRLAVFQ